VEHARHGACLLHETWPNPPCRCVVGCVDCHGNCCADTNAGSCPTSSCIANFLGSRNMNVSCMLQITSAVRAVCLDSSLQAAVVVRPDDAYIAACCI